MRPPLLNGSETINDKLRFVPVLYRGTNIAIKTNPADLYFRDKHDCNHVYSEHLEDNSVKAGGCLTAPAKEPQVSLFTDLLNQTKAVTSLE